MDLKQSMAGTAIVTHYLEPFDRHKKYYDFMARAYDASIDNADSAMSECLPEDTECQQNTYAFLSQTDKDCTNYGGLGIIGEAACVGGKSFTKGLSDAQKTAGTVGSSIQKGAGDLGANVQKGVSQGAKSFTDSANKTGEGLGKFSYNLQQGVSQGAKTTGQIFSGPMGMLIPIAIILVIIIILKRR